MFIFFFFALRNKEKENRTKRSVFSEGQSPKNESPMKRNKKRSFLWSEMKDWVARKYKKRKTRRATNLPAVKKQYLFSKPEQTRFKFLNFLIK